ncbi:MAG: [NiFe] hydrogenase metallocenter assembly protein HypF [Anaerolineae bacterium]|jgi:hydrogenase maturation protein HypF|nr:MAG: [NiFe] hydrogenase metallocenter assembly protein HypF [Anaerolineae bacterium]
MAGRYIRITGIVQGVGFRPFVYKLAHQENLVGWVKNTSAGVEIIVEGKDDAIAHFIDRLSKEAPPLSRIDQIEISPVAENHFTKFEIIESQDIDSAFIPISPDISICTDCLRELFDPQNRRYLYPFINCTNCGPRFTITKTIPYDRPNTTMAGFPLCPDCAAEYHDPEDRRFHAQPVACAVCGPHLSLLINGQQIAGSDKDLILAVQKLLKGGSIVAIKGIGGFHLACDAQNPQAVATLRERKRRVDKPFALMMPDLEIIERHCFLTSADIELLTSRERPIVLLAKKPASSIVPATAPQQNSLGVMLPYSPLHYLLFYNFEQRAYHDYPLEAIVLTSGNLSEEPIAIDNDQALTQLASLADAFLLHNRPIYIRCDDSVVRSVSLHREHHLYPIRRSRGYAPNPVRLPWKVPQILGVGAELKNTFCLTRDEYAFLSHHIGDLENFETYQSFEEGIEHYQRLFRIRPEVIAYDKHPNYLSTRYTLERLQQERIPGIAIQHHHAHIASCLADNSWQRDEPVIGVSFDGTGYGDDGAIWGGEILISSYSSYTRAAHLQYFPLPGGDRSIRFPARIALAYLAHFGIETSESLPPHRALCADERQLLYSQLKHKINLVNTSSMGRVFDLVASLIGVRQAINYEAQAAIELEAIASKEENHPYPFDISFAQNGSGYPIQISVVKTIQSILEDFLGGVSPTVISGRFHHTVAEIVREVCQIIRGQTGIRSVALSGGVWQNITLLEQAFNLLKEAGFEVLTHREIPANDGGISLGQVAVAAKVFE